MNSELVSNVRNLPLAERIELIDLLWESITEQGYEPPLTTEQAAELDRRLEVIARIPPVLFPGTPSKKLSLHTSFRDRI